MKHALRSRIACVATLLVGAGAPMAALGGVSCDESGNAPLPPSGLDAGSHEPGFDGAGLQLTSLVIGPTDDPDASVLEPPFSPDINDYYVRCDAGTNALTVSMAASAGARTAELAPTTSAEAPAQTLFLGVEENQAIVVAATDGTSSNAYWIRCLPHDAPSVRMVAHPDAGTPSPGYYLVGSAHAEHGAGYALVLDVRGTPLWYYREPTGVSVVDSLEPGTISFDPFPAPPLGYEVHQLSPFQTTVVKPNGYVLDGHELQRLPNGHYLLFSDSIEKDVDLTGYDVDEADGGVLKFGRHSSMLPCEVLEVDPATGDVAWSWNGLEHFDPVRDSTYKQQAVFAAGGMEGLVADPFHCNSIDVDRANGNLLISARHMDSVFYVDYVSRRVLWKIGGASYSKDGARYVPVDDPFRRQHDARFLPGWSSKCAGTGSISLFDDETGTTNPARGAIYDVTVGDGGGCGSPSAKLSWQYAGGAPSIGLGSLRVASDGSRLVGWGRSGVVGSIFSEIDAKGNDLLDLYFTDEDYSYRSIKVPTTALDLGLLRGTAGVCDPSSMPPGGCP